MIYEKELDDIITYYWLSDLVSRKGSMALSESEIQMLEDFDKKYNGRPNKITEILLDMISALRTDIRHYKHELNFIKK